MPRLNPFLSDNDDDDPIDRLESFGLPGEDENLPESISRMNTELIEDLENRPEQLIEDAEIEDLENELSEEEDTLIEGASLIQGPGRPSDPRLGALPIGSEALRESLELDPLFEQSLQRKIAEQMDQPDKRFDDEQRNRAVDELVRNTVRGELSGVPTARDFFRQGSGVG